MSSEHERPSFPVAEDGYDPEAVDAYLDAIERSESVLRERIEELERKNADLGRQLERLRGELDALRATATDLKRLEGSIDEVRSGYRERVGALESIVLSVVREASERLETASASNGGSRRAGSGDPEGGEGSADRPDEPYRGDWSPPAG